MPVIYNPTIIVNNETVYCLPNTCTYTEGFGESQKRVVVAGKARKTVFSKNLETAKSSVKFTLSNTNESVELARAWKSNDDNNLIELVDNDTGFTRTFPKAALTSDPENELSYDGNIALEWESDPCY